MEVAAKLRAARISAQKARLVADQVRGKPVGEALNLLEFSNKTAAPLLRKVLTSALANPEHSEGAEVDELSASATYFHQGVHMKRPNPSAQSPAAPFVTRTSPFQVQFPIS